MIDPESTKIALTAPFPNISKSFDIPLVGKTINQFQKEKKGKQKGQKDFRQLIAKMFHSHRR
jgi:hypothetical protein